MSTGEKGVGRNHATPEGAPKGSVGADQKTLDLLEYQRQMYDTDPNDPIKRLGLGKKIKEMDPDFKK